MISYNKTWLANIRLQAILKNDLSRGRITATEFKAITEKYPVEFYTPNIFARIGLFILTVIIVLFADGVLSLMAASSGAIENSGWYFFLALLSYAALELVINVKNHYKSGVDDALLVTTGCLLVVAFNLLLYRSNVTSYYLIISEIIFAITLYLTARFADILAGTVCSIAFFSFIFFGWTGYLAHGLATVPFVMMGFAAWLYWRARVYGSKPQLINYQSPLVVTQFISLITFYAAGNYYAIQTLSENMDKGGQIPFGWFFWACTILLPFVYIGLGIKRKDYTLLRTGLLLITAAAVTFRAYYHVLPVDVALILAGAVLLGVVYFLVKYLKIPKYGFTYAEQDEVDLMDQLKIESLIIAETFSHVPAAPANDGEKFGGGDFGGGGSSSSF